VIARTAGVSLVARYTAREVLSHLAGISAVVLGIFILRRFGLLLDEAADGSLPLSVVLHLLGLRTVVALPSLAPAALYFSVLVALGRLHQDHEMRALEACGVSPRRVERAVLGLALGVAVGIALLSCWARPLAATRFDAVRHDAHAAAGIDRMHPGRFYELPGEVEQVVLAGGRAADDPRALENVFVQRRDAEGVVVLTARRAVEQRGAAARFLRMVDGYQYDIDPQGQVREITRYEEMTLRTQVAEAPLDAGEERARSTSALWRSHDRRDLAELQWRLAMPVSAVLLVLAAFPLGRVDPRHGRHGRLVIGLVVYVVYRQLLGATQSWIESGALPAFPGLWGVHLAFLLVTFAWRAHAEGGARAWLGRPVRLEGAAR
jgi:lipopolysaccharide export system permease protein